MLTRTSLQCRDACPRSWLLPNYTGSAPAALQHKGPLPCTEAPSGCRSTAGPACGTALRTSRYASSTCAHSLALDTSWVTNIDALAVARQLNMASLLPYLAFLFFLTTSRKTPKLTLAGFWFVLVFVAVTIPAGMYATSHHGTVLANVDWLHGTTESLLTLCNLLIVLGLRKAIRHQQEEDVCIAGDKAMAQDDSRDPCATRVHRSPTEAPTQGNQQTDIDATADMESQTAHSQ